ncbi:hypothetical protein EJ04DRAFT_499452 [Polyplosphaeria fusca]|uniref:RWD domain-containing protein n=1 Tax=Polyplosphaeria fusca TaxID=682080 RepID=A0A9P4QP34_9PLEO|nr:hypothetical protein EJ04DRAFT_499452 [Polyplosphaeria fusca]
MSDDSRYSLFDDWHVTPAQQRLESELSLLEAMYHNQTQFDVRTYDFKFVDRTALLHLRLPEKYPEEGLPEIIEARGLSKDDARDKIKPVIATLREGEEVLDAVIEAFQSIVAETGGSSLLAPDNEPSNDAAATEANKTVIIWLHHLLALTKRKLALSPAPSIAGMTKPGYPGVMIFTGPANAVKDHVSALKTENWQAFQVRYEAEELWTFGHGMSVREVETIAEVAKAIEAGNEGVLRKESFLKAVGIK